MIVITGIVPNRRYGLDSVSAHTPAYDKQRIFDPNLFGWAGIEDVMSKNDKTTMNYYSDDIDTLLVFVRFYGFLRLGSVTLTNEPNV